MANSYSAEEPSPPEPDHNPEIAMQELAECETQQTANTQDSGQALEPDTEKKKKRKKKNKNKPKDSEQQAISILECVSPRALEEEPFDDLLRLEKAFEEVPLWRAKPVKFNKKALQRMDLIFKKHLCLN